MIGWTRVNQYTHTHAPTQSIDPKETKDGKQTHLPHPGQMQGPHAAHGVGQHVFLHVALVVPEQNGRAAEGVDGLVCFGFVWGV